MKMEKRVISSLILVLVSMQWHATFVESADDTEAKVTSATQKTDNQYMSVVKDEDAKSGWAIQAKKALSEKDINDKLYVFFLTRTDPKAKFEVSYASSFCRLLKNGNNSLIPKQIVDMIFPKQKNSCQFKPCESEIRAIAKVNTNADDNKGYFPKSTPYQMEVRMLNYDQAYKPDAGEYLFKVNFDIGGDINKK